MAGEEDGKYFLDINVTLTIDSLLRIASKSCSTNESLKRNNDHLDTKETLDNTSERNSPKLSHKSGEECDNGLASPAEISIEEINFVVGYMKEKYDLNLPASQTVAQLKKLLGMHFI